MAILRHYITKSDSKHNCRSPVIRPNILLKPLLINKIFDLQPTIFLVSHKNQSNGNKMSEKKIKKKYFDKSPILLSKTITDHRNLNVSDFTQSWL